MVNRRGFLASLLAATTVDPERLLWVPGRKTISIPKPFQLERYFFGEVFYVSERVAVDSSDFHAQFIMPAVERVHANMAQAAFRMISKPKFLQLEIPNDMSHAKHLPGGLRFMLASDIETGRLMGRVDALVEL